MSTFNGTDHAVKEKTRVGYQLREQGARAKYPVVMIPGFVTSGELILYSLFSGRFGNAHTMCS